MVAGECSVGARGQGRAGRWGMGQPSVRFGGVLGVGVRRGVPDAGGDLAGSSTASASRVQV